VVARRAQLRHRLQPLGPAFVHRPARHLEKQQVLPHFCPHARGFAAADAFEEPPRNPIGNHLGFDAESLQLRAHEAAHGGDAVGVAQPLPVNAIQAVGVVRVPQQLGVLAQPGQVQLIGQLDRCLGGLPLFGDHDQALASSNCWLRDLLHDERRHRLGQVDAFVVLAVVGAAGESAA